FEVQPQTSFEVRELTEATARLGIESGRVAADVKHGKRVVRVETKRGGPMGESRGGKFVAAAADDGTLVVLPSEGAVTLSSQGKSVEVAAGTQASATPDSPPSKPVSIP